jgi:UDP-glucuronate decarboxylase
MIKNAIMREDLEYIYKGLSGTEKSNFKDSNILITGAGGFIGYYLLNFLSEYSNVLEIKSITALDNFLLGKPKWITQIENEKLHIINFNVVSDKYEKIESIDKIDSIIHMASIASPTFYRQYPLKTLDANVLGLRKILDLFSKREIRGFLNFSSSEVYGDPDQSRVPIDEEYPGNVSFNGPRACYDEAKRFGETMCYIFNKEYDMNIVSVRPFNNYGPGMKLDDARAPADFANSIVTNKDITIFSDGKSTRTFTYIADAIIGYLKSLYYGKFDYFNIGMDKPEITIKQLAEIFSTNGEKIFGKKINLRFQNSSDPEYLTNNPRRRAPDIIKAKEKLNFKPTIDVNLGVNRFLKYLKEEFQ